MVDTQYLKWFFWNIEETRATEQNDGHFWIRHPQIALIKFLYTL